MSQTKPLHTYDFDPAAKMAYAPPVAVFAAFSIDPVATVEALHDPYATALARQISPRKYVGFVIQFHDLPIIESQRHRCTFLMISQGLPKLSREDYIDQSMCVPIAPTKAHSQGREHLHPNKRLPWKDVYALPHRQLTLSVKPRLMDHTFAPMISEDDTKRIELICVEDNIHRQKLISGEASFIEIPPSSSDAGTSGTLASDDSSSELDYEVEDPGDQPRSLEWYGVDIEACEELDRVFSGLKARATSDSKSEDGSCIDDSGLLSFWNLKEDPAHLTMPIVDVEYDLSTVGELNDPQLLLDELAVIETLVKESRARKLTHSDPAQEALLRAKETQEPVLQEAPRAHQTAHRLTLVSKLSRAIKGAVCIRANGNIDPSEGPITLTESVEFPLYRSGR